MNTKYIEKIETPKDKIDLTGPIRIKINIIPSKIENEFKIFLEGQCIDHSIVNTIRRTILTQIPIYGFHRANVSIDHEKCHYMYNNDFIYNQIETLPIFDVQNDYDLENPELYLTNKIIKKIFGHFYELDKQEEEEEREKPKKMLNIELFINYKNKSNDYKYIDSHDCILKINGKEVDSYKKRKPICIFVLKPGEEAYLKATANLGIAKLYASYEATTNVIHIQHSPDKYELKYETLEQLDKQVIFIKACVILSKKLENLKNYLVSQYKEEIPPDGTIIIHLYGEDHTIGNLLATTLQKCENVEFAGYTMPHPLTSHIIISYRLKSQTREKPIALLISAISYLISIYQKILGSVSSKK